MSKDKPTYRIITEQELQDYLSGKLSPSRSHDLEWQALHSAMEGDALEGWESHDAAYLMYDMTLLRERLARKPSRKAGIWMAVAAAVLLIIGVGYVVKFLLSEEVEKKPIALQKEKQSKHRDSLAIAQVAPVFPEKSVEVKAANKPKKEKKTKPPTIEKPEEDMIALNTAPVVQPMSEEIVLEESFEMEDLAMVEMEIPVEEIRSKKQAKIDIQSSRNATGAVSRSASAPMSEGTYTVFGVVTDEYDEPLPGVSIVVKGSDLGTATDIEGYFSIDLQGEKKTLEFQFIGYATAERIVNNEGAIKVRLNQDMLALEEVVVRGYSAQSRSDVTGSVSTVARDDFANSYEKAYPSNGWDALAIDLENNKKMPEEALKKGIAGRVKLKLTISSRGEITNIEVKKGLGYGCDEEAIRLIKSTGMWVPARQNDEAVESTQTYRINFP